MFIPGEVFYSAALQEMPELIELSAQENVLIATPTILIALLRAVHLGWREKHLAEKAAEIGNLANELYGRAHTLFDHFNRVGSGLNRALNAYNEAVGSWEGRYLPSVRRLKELGATDRETLPRLDPLETNVRTLSQQPDLLLPDED